MPPRILIVDDEPNILGTLAPILRDRGYEVFTAMNGGSALETVMSSSRTPADRSAFTALCAASPSAYNA